MTVLTSAHRPMMTDSVGPVAVQAGGVEPSALNYKILKKPGSDRGRTIAEPIDGWRPVDTIFSTQAREKPHFRVLNKQFVQHRTEFSALRNKRRQN